MRITELPKPKYVVLLWSHCSEGRWLRGPWYFSEQLAKDAVRFHQSRGRIAAYGREDPKP